MVRVQENVVAADVENDGDLFASETTFTVANSLHRISSRALQTNQARRQRALTNSCHSFGLNIGVNFARDACSEILTSLLSIYDNVNVTRTPRVKQEEAKKDARGQLTVDSPARDFGSWKRSLFHGGIYVRAVAKSVIILHLGISGGAGNEGAPAQQGSRRLEGEAEGREGPTACLWKRGHEVLF